MQHRVGLRKGLELLGIDRYRVPPDGYGPAVHPHGVVGEVDRQLEKLLASEEEIPCVALGLERDEVVADEAQHEFLTHPPGQHPPCVGLGPRYVDEMREGGIGTEAAHHAANHVQVVVVDHHRARARVLIHRLDDCIGEGRVHNPVPVLERSAFRDRDVRRVRQIPQLVLDEPDDRVRDHRVVPFEAVVIEVEQLYSLLGGPLGDTIVDEDALGCLESDRPVPVRARRADPYAVGQMGCERAQRRDETARAPLLHELAIRLDGELDRTSVGGDDPASVTLVRSEHHWTYCARSGQPPTHHCDKCSTTWYDPVRAGHPRQVPRV